MEKSYETRQGRVGGSRINSIILAAALCLGLSVHATPPPAGVASVLVPAGGFAIDGDLLANRPGADTGDWLLSTNAGSGGAVLNAAGVPLDLTRTFHYTDLYGSTSDNGFAKGKWMDNPTNWQWTASKANGKTDINNVLLHTSNDADGHSWVIIAADRMSTSGASYIDFEFLQNTLATNSGGAFTSAGPNGGRTVNDLLLSLAFTSGGSVADFFAYRWQTNGAGGFTYLDVTTSFPTGRVFVAASAANTAVPFGAFGNPIYGANQFAEAAVDLTALLGNFDPCLSIGFATIMVKTKDSPSSSATMSDFISPIKYNLRVGPSANAGPDQTQCTQGDSTLFALHGQATAGLKPIISTNWTVVSGSATIDDPTSLDTTVQVSSATATLRLMVVQTNGCTETDDVVLNVSPLPVCAVTGPSLVCPRSATQFRGPLGMGTYSWSVTGNASITGATNAQTVTVTAGPVCDSSFTLVLNLVSNNCVSFCTTDVLVNDTVPPTITSIPANLTLQCASAVPAPNDGAVVATDNCPSPLAVTHSDQLAPGNCANNFVIQRTYTVTDSCGNSTNAVQTITVNDITVPAITSIPTNVTVKCASAIPAANEGAVVATDTCGGVPVITHSDQTVPGACSDKFVVIRTYTATDLCGNTSSRAQTITVNDTNAPVITIIPANVTVQCAADVPAADDNAVVATDNCGAAPIITHNDQTTPGSCINKFVLKRTYTATDACGNSSSLIQTITVNDTNAPVITSIPADVTVQCSGDVPAADDTAVVATDRCGGTPVITHSDQTTPGACANKFVVKRTYTATDVCGNRSTLIQTITVNDTTAPVITSIPSDVTIQCASALPTANRGAVVSTDNCSGTPVITHSDQTIPGTCVNKFVVKRTYTATDTCGNSSSLIQTITVNDNTAPVITSIPTNVTVQCASAVPAPNDATVVATDNCSGPLTVTHGDQLAPGSCANNFVIQRTYTVTDSCGNSTNAVQTITVNDITLPVIASIPTNVTVKCASAVPAPNDSAVAATDACGGTPVITHSDQSVPGACSDKFVVIRTYTATDLCGNSTSRAQTITVNDTNAPVITSIPANVTVQCAGDVPVPNDIAVVATDNCGATPVITHADQTIPGNCVNKFTLKRTYTATDACGNSSSLIQTITVNDTNAPIITRIPPDVTVQCAGEVPAPNDIAVLATDSCGGAPVITHSDQTTPGACANKFVLKRTYTATDACGNRSSLVQTITVNDTNGPVITSIPADLTVQCAAAVPAANHGAVVATDVCGGTPVISHSDQTIPGACANKFVVKRTYTATDACGNSNSLIQTITVNDTTLPVITSIPADVTVQCASAVPAANNGAVVATDGCGGTPVIAHTDQTIPGTCANKFVVKRTYTATDTCGNVGSLTQTITVNDNTPPALTIPPDLTLECPANTATNSTGVATALDNCSPVTVSYNDVVNNGCGGARIILRRWTATDQCGNATNRVQSITLRDTTRPTITIPPNLTVECGTSTLPAATGSATAQDTCSSVSVSYSDSISNNCGGSRIITRTWLATDACGNTASGLQTITVRDTTPPALTLPSNLVLQCPGDTRTNVTGVPAVHDGCGSVTLNYSDVVSNGCALTRTVQRLWTATDQCGNSTNGLQTITVVDTTKPSISCPKISVQCVDDVPPSYATFAAFLAAGGTATDSCSSVLAFSQTSDGALIGRCPGTVTRVYRVTDACGNFGECTQTITVDDTIPPALTCPTNVIVECGSSLDPANIGRATATDNCSTNVTISYTDATLQSQYNLSFLVADPDSGTGPYGPTYLKFAPGSLPCPDSANLTGRALDPLRNAVAYAPGGQLDALTSIGNVPMAFGQIVPYEVVIQPSGGPGPERGTIEFTADWSTYTTSNNRFGYDTNYMIYCAFVDAADPGSLDPNANARVESYSSVVVNRGSIDEAIRGTFRVSGLDSGDRVVVEIWVVLMPNMPDHSGGTVAASLVSAQTAANPPVGISIGTQTDSLGNLSKIFPLPPPQEQPPLGPLPQQPPVLPGATVSVINRTWSGTDDCGNRSTCVQQITVRDTAPPVISVPADVVLECPATDTSTNVTGVATAPDTCGGSVKMYYSDVVSNACAATRVVSRTWTATDLAGNTTNVVQTITVRDTTPPALVCPPDRAVSVTNLWTFDDPTASDTCSSVTVQVLGTTTNRMDTGTLVATRTWMATDACGNTNTCQQNITVLMGSPPNITSSPRSQILPYGSDLTMNVTANSPTPCYYQWRMGGADIAGATSSSLALHNLQFTNAGVYTVMVGNAAGTAGSQPAVLDVAVKLIYQSPGNGKALTWPGPFVLQSAPAVNGPYSDVPGAVSPFTPQTSLARQFFRLRSPSVSFSTNYFGGQFSLSGPGVPGCNLIFQATTNQTDWVNLATNPCPVQFIDTETAQFPNRTYRVVMAQPIVNPPPPEPLSITAAPQGQTAAFGNDTVLSVSASGSGPVTYQWQLNGANIAGANGTSLSLDNLQFTDAGLYSVVISNAAGVVTTPAVVVNVGANLSQQLSGSSMQLTWAAPFVLQSASSAAGPYSDLAGATSPYSHNTANGPRQFFRLRSPPIQFTSTYLPGGQFSMSGPGVPGYNFVFQASTDQVHWINLQTNASPVTFVDADAALYPNRTYRAIIAH